MPQEGPLVPAASPWHRRHRVGGAGDVGTGPVKGESLKKLSYRVIIVGN